MALKSTTKKPKGALKENLVYPCLRRGRRTYSSSGDFVVLFTGPREGTVVYSGPQSPWALGVYSTHWIDAGTREDWTPVRSITIEEA